MNSHRIYLRDWYFNAGIAGFLRLGKGISTDTPHYIEFSNDVFKGLEERLKAEVFLTYFKIQPYLRKLKKAKEEIEKELQKPGRLSPPKKWIEVLSKFPYRGMPEALSLGFDNAQDLNQLVTILDENTAFFISKNSEQILAELQKIDLGNAYLDYFITLKLKGFCSISGVSNLIRQISEIDYSVKPLKPNQCCLSCQDPHRKADIELSNSVSNIIGFNKDNANWVWGYKSSNIKVCPLCALINISSIAGLTYTTYLDKGEWLDAYYFVNQSNSVAILLNTTNLLKNTIKEGRDEGGETFYQLVKNMMIELKGTQAKSLNEGLHMIEIIQNPILGGQSSKGYNVFNYNLDKNTATFLRQNITNIPMGYYKNGDTSIDLQMELLQKVINNRLTKQDLYLYTLFQVQELTKKKGIAGYRLGLVVEFVFKFWSAKKGGQLMTERTQEKIYNNGYGAGKDLRNQLLKDNKSNQISGIAHGLLNSLKIEDKSRFLDEYFRLVMRYDIPMRVFKQEMTNTDDFLQFGYAFLSGLISKESNKQQNEITEASAA